MGAVTLRIPREIALPNNEQWENRFEITSESSGDIYVIAQNKKKRHWSCSCRGYLIHRKCKHLESLGLPTHEKPYEPRITA